MKGRIILCIPLSVCKGGVTSPGSLLSLTGVITHEQLATSDIQPDYVCESIAELADALEQSEECSSGVSSVPSSGKQAVG
jgi:hypothetical protein